MRPSLFRKMSLGSEHAYWIRHGTLYPLSLDSIALEAGVIDSPPSDVHRSSGAMLLPTSFMTWIT